MVSYEIYREDGGNGITFVHMLYYIMINNCTLWIGQIMFYRPIKVHRHRTKSEGGVCSPWDISLIALPNSVAEVMIGVLYTHNPFRGDWCIMCCKQVICFCASQNIHTSSNASFYCIRLIAQTTTVREIIRNRTIWYFVWNLSWW